ncbi:hypothetical protein GCM10027360_26880 [Amycolatopsis echigonensis]
MQQFEELLHAASVVSPAARPLPLYYALNQAGRAIAALHAVGSWELKGHGLKAKTDASRINDMTVELQGKESGAFHAVAAATGSPSLPSAVSVEALWASLPEFMDNPLPGSERDRVLRIFPEMPVPGHAPPLIYEATITRLPGIAPEKESWVSSVADIMSNYPLIPPWSVEPMLPRCQQFDETTWDITMRWHISSEQQSTLEPTVESFYDGFAPAYIFSTDRFIRPKIDEENSALPSPLMTWWALLYAFSMLARYEPRKWVSLLDINESAYAVPLEFALHEAAEVIPQLVLGALDGVPTFRNRTITV